MPYIPHIRTTTTWALGVPATPVETASCTMSFLPSITTPEILTGINDELYADWATWTASSNARVGSNVSLVEVKSCLVGADGRMIGDPYLKHPTGIAPAGASGTNLHPLQISMCLTLVCGAAGKGRLGRLFLPPMSFQVTQDGLVDTTNHPLILSSCKTLLDAINAHTAFDPGWGVAVAGKTGTGTLRPVTSIRLGKAADTQRRRRRNLDEAYVSATLA